MKKIKKAMKIAKQIEKREKVAKKAQRKAIKITQALSLKGIHPDIIQKTLHEIGIYDFGVKHYLLDLYIYRKYYIKNNKGNNE